MAEQNSKPAKAWGGVFTEATDALFERFSESISFDSRMYEQDIEGSIAHATMLGECGIIAKSESEKILSALKEILPDIEA